MIHCSPTSRKVLKAELNSAISSTVKCRNKLLLRGQVQGVGMRPFLCRLAQDMGLVGWVGNAPEGVVIEAEGTEATLALFEQRIQQEAPPQAHIVECITTVLPAINQEQSFCVVPSLSVGSPAPCAPPDLAACPDCLRELYDPSDRRYRYPFLSCSHCGPRYSILHSLPFDRERTSMAEFVLCPACQGEYANPANRRFHAQTTCCPDCGPRLALWDGHGQALADGETALNLAVNRLRQGAILALKGIGGFQLLVDANNPAALERLRIRKNRPHKPLALLVDRIMADQLCHIEAAEAALLTSSAAPIVLCNGGGLPTVAPDLPWLGIILPASPLHHLLLSDFGSPLVATSGNRSGEPICINEQEAVQRLGDIADVFLVHNRPILRPLDDSVMRIALGQPLMLRRARGYAPTPINLVDPIPPTLAVGGYLKNTVAVGNGHRAILSQHLGDLDDALSLAQCRTSLDELSRLYDIQPNTVVCDAHPDYASSHLAETFGLPVIAVAHHYAHALACVAEHGLKPPLLAIAWDGIGLGENGELWGGEFLRIEANGYIRVGSIWPLHLLGGDKAVKQPRRVALAALHELYGAAYSAQLPEPVRLAFSDSELSALHTMLEKSINAPVCSSVGRLFDAVAALLGLCQINSYEGQAAMLLEASAMSFVLSSEAHCPPSEKPPRSGLAHAWSKGALTYEANPPRIDWRPLLRDLLAQQAQGATTACLAYRFHASLAQAAATMAQQIGLQTVVLCGGCFQNRLLLELCHAQLQRIGCDAHWPQRVPPNDGGLALGQLLASAMCPI